MDGDLVITFADVDVQPMMLLDDAEDKKEITEDARITRDHLEIKCFGATFAKEDRTCGDCLEGCEECASEALCYECVRGYSFPPEGPVVISGVEGDLVHGEVEAPAEVSIANGVAGEVAAGKEVLPPVETAICVPCTIPFCEHCADGSCLDCEDKYFIDQDDFCVDDCGLMFFNDEESERCEACNEGCA